MKKYFSAILILLVLIINGCKEKKDYDYYKIQLNLIENQYNNINKRLDYLYKLDTFQFSKRKSRINEIRSDFTILREQLSSSINDQEIHNIKIKLLQIGVKEENITSFVSLLKINDLNQNEKQINLNFLELLFLEYYNDFYNNLFYNAFRFAPIVVPHKNPIKLGEEYKCEIYLAGYNGFNFIGKVDNKVLKNELETPVFKIKPKTKGKKEFKGEFGLKLDILSKDTFYFPFTISFDVE